MTLSEVLQDSRTVVADRRELQSFRFKSLFCILQLHELRFAERSAIGGMEERRTVPFKLFSVSFDCSWPN